VTSFATGAIGSEYTPAVAFNPIKNLYQVVWSDSRAVTSWDIYAQRVRGNGNLIGDAFGVATTDDAQHRPDIAFDPYDLEFYVVWQDDRRASWDIYGQLTSSYGRLRGGQRRIGLSPGDDRFPAVSRAATPSSSRYLVVWSGPRKDLTDTDIRGRFVDSKGNPIGPTDFSIDSDTDYQYRPALAHMSDLSTNDYLVAWLNDPDTTHDIWGRVFP
jgi:hypothetical protein